METAFIIALPDFTLPQSECFKVMDLCSKHSVSCDRTSRLCGAAKRRRVRTVAVPICVKVGINAWTTAAGIEDGRLLRSISKSGKVGWPGPERLGSMVSGQALRKGNKNRALRRS
jgi:hypothetical protein